LKAILGSGGDFYIAAAVVAVVMMLVIPIPTMLLDALMAANLILSILILLIVLYTRRATEFSQFPTILLISTIFGLALNVSSTRLILTQGVNFNGRMVRAFSSFVVGSGGREGLVVGFVIFIVLIAVQMLVITKGSTRIAEVAARFALDSMQNKYMAIDMEFHAGTINEQEASERRTVIQQEMQFYGTMDGASKFIAGNVKAGIFITIINILGGVIIGSAINGEDISSAFGTYISFAIGDGLLSQFPSLLVSTATGLIVTRSISTGTFAEDVSDEFTRQPRIFWIGAVVLFIFALIPGFPKPVLFPMSLLMGFFAFRLTAKSGRKAEAGEEEAKAAAAKKTGEDASEIPSIVPLDPLSIEMGYGLIPLVDKDKGAELLERVQRLRREAALDLGLKIPRVRILDNMRLEPSEYCL
jgi:flagellar biosynthesis protein FlhA